MGFVSSEGPRVFLVLKVSEKLWFPTSPVMMGLWCDSGDPLPSGAEVKMLHVISLLLDMPSCNST